MCSYPCPCNLRYMESTRRSCREAMARLLSARRPRRVVRGLGRAFLYLSIYLVYYATNHARRETCGPPPTHPNIIRNSNERRRSPRGSRLSPHVRSLASPHVRAAQTRSCGARLQTPETSIEFSTLHANGISTPDTKSDNRLMHTSRSNYLERSCAGQRSAGTFTVAQERVRHPLCDHEGGGWWHVRPRVRCVPSLEIKIRDFSAQTP
jgi:hypothetical protein